MTATPTVTASALLGVFALAASIAGPVVAADNMAMKKPPAMER